MDALALLEQGAGIGIVGDRIEETQGDLTAEGRDCQAKWRRLP